MSFGPLPIPTGVADAPFAAPVAHGHARHALDRALRWSAPGLVAAWVVHAALVFVGPSHTRAGVVAGETIPLMMGAVAAALCLHAAWRSTADRRAWTLMGVAMATWTSGQFMWWWYVVPLATEAPFPGPPDVGYLLAVPIAVAAVLAFRRRPAGGAARLRSGIDASLTVLAMFVLMWGGILERLQLSDATSALARDVAIAYPVSEFFILAALVAVAGRVPLARRRSQILLSAGFVVLAITDCLFTLLGITGDYATGALMDPGWTLALLLIAWAAVVAPRSLGEDRAVGPEPVVVSAGIAVAAVAFVALGLWSGWVIEREVDLVALVPAVGTIGLLVARQAVTQADNRRLVSELETANSELVSRNTLLERVLDMTQDAVFLGDLDDRLVFANGAAARSLGGPPEQFVGRTVHQMFPVETARRMQAQADEALASGARSVVELDVPIPGGERTFVITRQRYELGGRPVGILGIARDVTDERLALLSRAEAERLRAVNAARAQLLNAMAHELNTPLTPLRLQVHMLTSGRMGPLSDKQRHALGVVDRNLRRLGGLVEDVRDVGRLQAGRVTLKPAKVGLAALVTDVVEMYHHMAEQAGVRFDVDVPVAMELVADRERLTQVLVNLVSNALKFTPRGGVVTVRATADAGETCVRVTDTGVGLTSEQIARLFQPFSQVHDTTTHTVGGTGLGLYICKGLVEAHGGRIWAESAGSGRGSTFSFVVPATPMPPPTPAFAPVETPSADPAPA